VLSEGRCAGSPISRFARPKWVLPSDHATRWASDLRRSATFASRLMDDAKPILPLPFGGRCQNEFCKWWLSGTADEMLPQAAENSLLI